MLRLLLSPHDSPSQSPRNPVPSVLMLATVPLRTVTKNRRVAGRRRGRRRFRAAPASAAGSGVRHERHAVPTGIAGPAAWWLRHRVGAVSLVVPAQGSREWRGGARDTWRCGTRVRKVDGTGRAGFTRAFAAENPVVGGAAQEHTFVGSIGTPGGGTARVRREGVVVGTVAEKRDKNTFLHQLVHDVDRWVEGFWWWWHAHVWR